MTYTNEVTTYTYRNHTITKTDTGGRRLSYEIDYRIDVGDGNIALAFTLADAKAMIDSRVDHNDPEHVAAVNELLRTTTA